MPVPRPAPRSAAIAFAALTVLAAGCGSGPALLVDDPLVARVYEVVPTGVTVRNDAGVINLTGFIQGVGDEGQIVEAVSSIEGVRRVDSNLIVRSGED